MNEEFLPDCRPVGEGNGMDINKIHYFFRAAEQQNFTRAAELCHIAQTTMSKYISVLEGELGCELFVRTGRTARLTPQGQRFYDGMKAIMKQYKDLCREVGRENAHELHIGMITTDYEDFPILRTFELANPEIAAYFSFGDESRLLADLRHHRIDAVICPNILTFKESRVEDMTRVDLLRIEESLVCSRELLYKCGSVAQVVAGQPLITKTAETEYQEFCRENLCRIYGVQFPDVLVVTSYAQQLLMLNLSRGFAIIPAKAKHEYENLCFIKTDDSLSETVQLLYHPSFVTPELQALLDHIHENKC